MPATRPFVSAPSLTARWAWPLLVAISLFVPTSGWAQADVHVLQRHEALEGVTRVAIETQIDGIRGISSSRIQSRMEGALRRAGITFEAIDPRTHDYGVHPAGLPVLVFDLDAKSGYDCNTTVVAFDMQLRVSQPAYVLTPGGERRLAWTTGYYTGGYGYTSGMGIQSQLYGMADDLIADFIADWNEAN